MDVQCFELHVQAVGRASCPEKSLNEIGTGFTHASSPAACFRHGRGTSLRIYLPL